MPALRYTLVRLAHLGASALLLGALAQPSRAADTAPSLCIWDMVGTAGPMFDAARNYALAMQQQGFEIRLKAYVDERVAAEDFRVGQCDGLLATSLRTAPYSPIPAAIGYAGATTILREGRVDVPAGIDVARKAVQAFASPAAAKLVVHDHFENGGIIPTGAIYIFARDRATFKEGFAGKRMPAFDHDKVQAMMIQRAGAQAVSADLNTVASKFNNGAVDVIFLPAVAYQPLEIFRGVGTKGAVARLPLMFSTAQLVFNQRRFPPGFGQKSREYWAAAFDEAMRMMSNSEAALPPQLWFDYPAPEAAAFITSQRDLRVELAKAGYYNKAGLKVLKRIRCGVYPASAECSTPAEIEW